MEWVKKWTNRQLTAVVGKQNVGSETCSTLSTISSLAPLLPTKWQSFVIHLQSLISQ